MHKGTPRILSIGAATQDVFLTGKIFNPVHDHKKLIEELTMGAKLEVENIIFSTGGGACNAAVTFARQGLETLFMGAVGEDPAGEAVLHDLDKENIDTRHLERSSYSTGYSAILLAPDGERTVLTYRGASAHMDPLHFNIDKIDVDWIYMSSMAGNFEVTEKIVTKAHERGIKIAFNPGKDELAHPQKLRTLLEDIEILQLNKEEMQLIVEGSTKEELARHAAHYVPYAVVTDGPKGVSAVGQQKMVTAGMYDDSPVVDRLGAGDAFCSGVVAMIATGKTLEEAIIFGSANSTSVVGKIGAKTGILHKDAKLHDMPLKITQLQV
jgi:sugar/nucleoside kinase (ribokinase family)